MLAAEVLVEAAQRLSGSLDDLLDREVLARARVQQLHGGVEEALDPALGAEPGGVERTRHCEVTPTRRVRLGVLDRQFVLHNRRAYPMLGRDTRSLLGDTMQFIGQELASAAPLAGPGTVRSEDVGPDTSTPTGPARRPLPWGRRRPIRRPARSACPCWRRRCRARGAGATPRPGTRRSPASSTATAERVRLLGQRLEVELVEIEPWRRRDAGRRRRRTPGARPWCSTVAWRTVRARSRVTSRRTARDRRRRREGVGIRTRSSLRMRPRSGPVSPWTSDNRPRRHALSCADAEGGSPGRSSGNSVTARDSSIVCVASRVLPSCSEYSLNVTAASSWRSRSVGVLRRHEVERALEDVGVVRGRPVVVREVPARLPDQEHEVGEEDERVDAPGLVAGRVQRGGSCVEALDVGPVPGTEEPAVEHPLDRLDHVEVLGWGHAAPRRHHAVRTLDARRPAPRTRRPTACGTPRRWPASRAGSVRGRTRRRRR